MKNPDLDPRRKKLLIYLAVFAVALVLRVIFVLQWNDTPYGPVPLLDAQVYDNWAKDIAGGQLLRARAFYASPLYPYIVGLLYALFGHSLLLAGLFNALLGAATAVMLSALAFTCFGLEAAALTGLLAAGYLPMIFYTGPVMKEPVVLFVMTAFLVFALRVIRENKLRDVFWAGVFFGLVVMVRGNALLLAPAVLALGFLKWKKRFTPGAAVFMLTMLVVLAPATIHNYIVARDFVPVNYADGFNFYIGNSPTANGTNEYPPEISSDPVQEELATIWEARENIGHAVKPSEVSAWWRGRALDFIIHNPGREMQLILNKFLAFWNSTETFDSYDIDFIRKNFDTILSGPMIAFWPISVLAAFGAIVAWRERREDVTVLGGFALVYMGSVLVFYIADRYRLPVTVFLLPLAGAALPFGRKLVKKHAWTRIGWASALALVFLILGLRAPSDALDLTAFDWGTLAMIYSDAGQNQETLDALHKAIAIPNGDPGAQAFIRAAFVEHDRGRDGEAENIFKIAMKRYPQDGVIQYNYGRLKAMQGDLATATRAFERGAELMPSYALNYYALAKIYQKLGDHLRANAAVKRGLQVDPSDKLLQEMAAELKSR